MQNCWKKMCLLIAASAALMLGGCGKDGKDGAPGKDATSAPVAVSSLTTDQWSALAPTGQVLGVTINSPPVVKFKLTDANGAPITGLSANMVQRTTGSTLDAIPYNGNVSFSIAKLVPGTNGAPSKWVNYIVTTRPSYKSATDKTIIPATATRPSTDNEGTLKENSDGTYQYTFYRDITKVKEQIAAMTLTAPNVAADLGDLTYDPNAIHRLTIQFSGNLYGTGSNTADGVTKTTAVAMKNPVNIIYDFIPATGKAVAKTDAQREITLISKCNECHSKLAFHGGGRVEARYCVVCHTDQRKFGRAEATKTATGYSGSTYRMDDRSAGDFPKMVHQIHMGSKLSLTGYDYAGVKYNDIKYPQDIRNCTKCHTKSDAAPQGDNWLSAPSRLACGSCHDGINWTTGAGHVGGSASSDQACALCHKAADITAYHPSKLPANFNADLRTMSATITGVTVAADGKVTAKFTVKDGTTPVTDLTKFTKPTFMLVKLVKNSAGVLDWVGYTNQWNTKVGTMLPILQTKGENDGTLVANADGSFSYTFKLKTAEPEGDIRNVNHAHNASTTAGAGIYKNDTVGPWNAATAIYYPPAGTAVGDATAANAVVVAYEPDKTHRVAMTFSKAYVAPATAPSTGAPGVDAWLDFRPDGKTVTDKREIVKMTNCANCHANGKLHAAFRIEVCVTCHNPSKDPYTGETVSLENIVHKIHMGKDLPSVKAGGSYQINGPGHDYSKGASPAPVKNCTICHVESGNAQGANWRTNPTANACITCHDGAASKAHAAQNANACATCHSSGRTAGADVAHQ